MKKSICTMLIAALFVMVCAFAQAAVTADPGKPVKMGTPDGEKPVLRADLNGLHGKAGHDGAPGARGRNGRTRVVHVSDNAYVNKRVAEIKAALREENRVNHGKISARAKQLAADLDTLLERVNGVENLTTALRADVDEMQGTFDQMGIRLDKLEDFRLEQAYRNGRYDANEGTVNSLRDAHFLAAEGVVVRTVPVPQYIPQPAAPAAPTTPAPGTQPAPAAPGATPVDPAAPVQPGAEATTPQTPVVPGTEVAPAAPGAPGAEVNPVTPTTPVAPEAAKADEPQTVKKALGEIASTWWIIPCLIGLGIAGLVFWIATIGGVDMTARIVLAAVIIAAAVGIGFVTAPKVATTVDTAPTCKVTPLVPEAPAPGTQAAPAAPAAPSLTPPTTPTAPVTPVTPAVPAPQAPPAASAAPAPAPATAAPAAPLAPATPAEQRASDYGQGQPVPSSG